MGIEGRGGKNKNKKEEPSRRHVLTTLAGGTAVVLGGMAMLPKRKGAVAEGLFERSPEVECDFSAVGLAGERCRGLACDYFGLASGAPFPKQKTIDFHEVLGKMWDRKIATTKRLSPNRLADITNLAEAQKERYRALWNARQEQDGIENFTDLVNYFAKVERETLESLDWDGVARYYGILDPWNLQMLKHLGSRAHGRSLAAYSMTEITPSGGENATDALRVYDALIRYAGMGFINAIPAMADARPSDGEFQLTDIPIDQDLTKERPIPVPKGDPLRDRYPHPAHDPHERHIEASMNDFLSNPLPKSIRDFRTTREHVTGALLFGLDGVARALRAVQEDDPGDDRVRRIAHMNGETFASVLAAHHYRPGIARKALTEWSKDENWGNDGSEHEPYYRLCADRDPAVGGYAARSHDNYLTIDGYFELQGY